MIFVIVSAATPRRRRPTILVPLIAQGRCPIAIAIGQRPCAIKGTNIVGLRRRGVAAETITKINESMKLWMRGDVEKERCLLEIESQYGEVSEVRRLVDFIRASQYGTAR